jgi:hypothetical protein
MTVISVTASHEHSIYAALELSKNSRLLTIQFPGGDIDGLMAKLDAARQRVTKDAGQTPAVIVLRGRLRWLLVGAVF